MKDKNKKISILLMVLFVFSACSKKEKEQTIVEQLIEQTNYIHDVETMPKMSKLVRLEKDIKKLQQQFIHEKDTNQMFFSAEGIVQDLNKAEDAMMTWMSNYHDVLHDLDQNEEAKQIKLIETQKTNIEIVKELMLSSMASANHFLAAQNINDNEE